ncbi:hypothetical protein T484DRAFT_2144061, partial [Baffinella frigidus]
VGLGSCIHTSHHTYHALSGAHAVLHRQFHPRTRPGEPVGGGGDCLGIEPNQRRRIVLLPRGGAGRFGVCGVRDCAGEIDGRAQTLGLAQRVLIGLASEAFVGKLVSPASFPLPTFREGVSWRGADVSLVGGGLLLAVQHGTLALETGLEIVDERGRRGGGGGVDAAHVVDAGEELVAVFDGAAVHGRCVSGACFVRPPSRVEF